jgi:hypothetical protein
MHVAVLQMLVAGEKKAQRGMAGKCASGAAHPSQLFCALRHLIIIMLPIQAIATTPSQHAARTLQ